MRPAITVPVAPDRRAGPCSSALAVNTGCGSVAWLPPARPPPAVPRPCGGPIGFPVPGNAVAAPVSAAGVAVRAGPVAGGGPVVVEVAGGGSVVGAGPALRRPSSGPPGAGVTMPANRGAAATGPMVSEPAASCRLTPGRLTPDPAPSPAAPGPSALRRARRGAPASGSPVPAVRRRARRGAPASGSAGPGAVASGSPGPGAVASGSESTGLAALGPVVPTGARGLGSLPSSAASPAGGAGSGPGAAPARPPATPASAWGSPPGTSPVFISFGRDPADLCRLPAAPVTRSIQQRVTDCLQAEKRRGRLRRGAVGPGRTATTGPRERGGGDRAGAAVTGPAVTGQGRRWLGPGRAPGTGSATSGPPLDRSGGVGYGSFT